MGRSLTVSPAGHKGARVCYPSAVSLRWPGVRVVSYGLVAAGMGVVAYCGLGPCLIAGLSAAMILDRTQRGLRSLSARPFVARWASVGFFLILATLLVSVFVAFVKL